MFPDSLSLSLSFLPHQRERRVRITLFSVFLSLSRCRRLLPSARATSACEQRCGAHLLWWRQRPKWHFHHRLLRSPFIQEKLVVQIVSLSLLFSPSVCRRKKMKREKKTRDEANLCSSLFYPRDAFSRSLLQRELKRRGNFISVRCSLLYLSIAWCHAKISSMRYSSDVHPGYDHSITNRGKFYATICNNGIIPKWIPRRSDVVEK